MEMSALYPRPSHLIDDSLKKVEKNSFYCLLQKRWMISPGASRSNPDLLKSVLHLSEKKFFFFFLLLPRHQSFTTRLALRSAAVPEKKPISRNLLFFLILFYLFFLFFFSLNLVSGRGHQGHPTHQLRLRTVSGFITRDFSPTLDYHVLLLGFPLSSGMR